MTMSGVVKDADMTVEGPVEEETVSIENEVKGREEIEGVSNMVLVGEKDISVDRVFENVEIEDKDTADVAVIDAPDPDDVVRVRVAGSVDTDVDSAAAVPVRDGDAEEGEVSAVDVPSDAVSRVDKKSSVDNGADDLRVDKDVWVGDNDDERDEVGSEDVRVGVNASVAEVSVPSTEVVRKDNVDSSTRVDSKEDDEVASTVVTVVAMSADVESRRAVDEKGKSREDVDVTSSVEEEIRVDEGFGVVIA